MSDLWITWEEYHEKIELLALKIYQSEYKFNQIICLAKGGLRIGDIFARLFDIPLAILSAKSYQGIGNRQRGEVHFSKHLSMVEETIGNRILLIDDMVDSGISLKESINWLNNNYQGEIQEIKTAVIWYKSCSIFEPDYYLEYFTDNPWIHQPFEVYEDITIKNLEVKLSKKNKN